MASGGGAIRAGRAFVELFLEDNKLYRLLDRLKQRFLNWAALMRRTGLRLSAGGSGILSPLLRAFEEAVGQGSKLQQLADKLGSTVETVSTLAHGFERADGSVDGFEAAITGLQEKIGAAADANAYLLDTLRSIGSGRQLEAMGLNEQLDAIAESISKIPTAANQLRAARALGLEQLIPWLKKGKQGMDELRESGKLGTISDQQGAQSRAVMRAYTDIWLDLKRAVLDVGLALLPTGGDLQEFTAEVRKGIADARDWVKENGAIVVAVAAVGAALVTTGTAFAVFGTVGTAAVTGVTTAVLILKGGLLALFSPVGLVTAAVVGLGVVLLKYTNAGRFALFAVEAAFRGIFRRVGEAWAGIKAAFQSGDWTLAFKIGFALIKAEWANLNVYIQTAWTVFKNAFIEGWRDLKFSLELVFKDIAQAIYAKLATGIRRVLNVARFAAQQIDKDLAKRISQTINGIPNEGELQNKYAEERKKFIDDRKKEKRESVNERMGELAKALKERDEARKELADLVAEAKAKSGQSFLQRIVELARRRGGVAGAGENAGRGLLPLAEAARGVFGGPIGQQLNYGDDMPKRQLDALNNIAANAAVLPQAAADLNKIAGALRFGR